MYSDNLMSAFRQDKDHTKTDSSNLPDIVDFLLSFGAYVDSVDVYGESYAGAQDDNYLTAVQKLVQAGGHSRTLEAELVLRRHSW